MNDKREKCEFDRNRPLFERKRIPCEVFVRCVDGNGQGPMHVNQASSRVQTLKKCTQFTLRIMQGTRCSTVGSGTSEKVFRFELTDEYAKALECTGVGDTNTSVQLYELEVGESDFADLRQDQALLVDFSNFATSFIHLLEMCELGHECDETNVSSSHFPSNPLFGCKVSATSGVIGSNLPMLDSSDRSVSSKYSCRLETHSNMGNSSLSWNTTAAASSGSSTTLKMARFSIMETNRFRELIHFSLNLRPASDTAVRNYLSMRLCEVMNCESTLQLQLNNQKVKMEKLECDFHAKNEQLGEFMEQSRVHTHSLHKEVEDKLHQEINSRRMEIDTMQRSYEQTIHDLKSNLLEEKAIYEQKLIDQERHYEECIRMVTNERNQMEINMQNSLKQVSSLEQVRDKQEASMNTLDDQCRIARSEISNLHTEIECHKTQLKSVSSQLESIQVDKEKLQQALKRYHDDRIEMKRRLKSKYDKLRAQEEALVSKDMEVSSMHARMEEMDNTIERQQNELSDKVKLIEELKSSLVDQKKTLDSNQQVINWLNKEISTIQKCGAGQKDFLGVGDDLIKSIVPMMDSSTYSRFNSGWISSSSLPNLYGSSSNSCLPTYTSPCVEKTPTKSIRAHSAVSSTLSPKPTRNLEHLAQIVPEPQPYTPRDQIIT